MFIGTVLPRYRNKNQLSSKCSFINMHPGILGEFLILIKLELSFVKVSSVIAGALSGGRFINVSKFSRNGIIQKWYK